MSELVKQQIKKILDEDSGRVHSVIVEMEDPDESSRIILEASTEALKRRHLTSSARELLPPAAEIIRKKAQPNPSELRRLRKAGDTVTSQIAQVAIKNVAMAVLQTTGLSVLAPLIDSDIVKNAMEAAIRRGKQPTKPKGSPPGFQTFWSSRSAVLSLRRDDLNKLSDLPKVGAVYPNRRVELPPIMEVKHIPGAIAENKTSAWGVEAIGALASWGAYGTKGKPKGSDLPVKVAVLDTGVDSKHSELLNKVVDWAEFDDEGGAVSGSRPYDSGQHGTHVCGTIAGSRREAPSADYPLIGIAPEAELAVGLVLKGGSGTYAQILAGMDWAIESGAEVINMSLGGVGFAPDVLDFYTRSIINANRIGIPVVVSIGNDGAQTSGAPGNDYFAFAVGATDYRDRPGGFSGGRTQVIEESRYIDDRYLPLIYSKPEVSAPGIAIRSCIPNDDYAVWNGTSMAAPHVSGALALLLAATEIRNIPAQRRAFVLQDLLVSSVEELGESGKDHRFGFGRINVLRAIAFAKEQGY